MDMIHFLLQISKSVKTEITNFIYIAKILTLSGVRLQKIKKVLLGAEGAFSENFGELWKVEGMPREGLRFF